MRTLLTLLLGLSLIACDKKGSVDSTKERARAEEEANGEVQRKILAEKAKKMEDDLAVRHFFYQAMSGKYEGDLVTNDGNLKIRITLAPSIPPYFGDRVRELSEIESDLNNLYFHAQIVQWHPDSQMSAVGCRITGLKPNIETGLLTIASTDCPNLYLVYIGDESSGKKTIDIEKRAAELAGVIYNEQLNKVPRLIGSVQPSTNASTYTFNAKRVEN